MIATVRITSSDLDPNLVTKVLKIEPTFSVLTGDFLYSNSKATAKENIWFLSNEDEKISNLFIFLQKMFDLVYLKLDKLKEISNVKIEFSLCLWIEDTNYSLPEELVLLIEKIKKIADFDLEICGTTSLNGYYSEALLYHVG